MRARRCVPPLRTLLPALLRLIASVIWSGSAALIALIAPVSALASDSVYLEDLSWTELRQTIASGKTTILIPVGGVEQSGPHMALGKHNVRAHVLAGRIATKLGNAMVAPVLAYVPEGNIDKPAGHMRFAGTISVSDAAFKGILEGAARSLKQHGFVNVVLMGDHGGYQTQLAAVAATLNHAWAGTPARAWFIEDYYRAASSGFAQVLRGKGYTDAQIGTHAGLADTALMLAIDPSLVRSGQLNHPIADKNASGVSGDPQFATAILGQSGVELIVASTVSAIRAAIGARH